ncbi:MAG TPA: hypothetical protein VES89_14220 [Candidatus Competibacteraceae bacterium]|nr:hypothetical protein [Candidatus Competibacteraceae bacterium]
MKRVACRLPAFLKEELNQVVRTSSYGPKGKSRWVREALKALFLEDPNLITVGVGEHLERNDAEEGFLLAPEQVENLEEGIRLIRSQNPWAEGVRSAIIRAAIRKRIGLVAVTATDCNKADDLLT